MSVHQENVDPRSLLIRSIVQKTDLTLQELTGSYFDLADNSVFSDKQARGEGSLYVGVPLHYVQLLYYSH